MITCGATCFTRVFLSGRFSRGKARNVCGAFYFGTNSHAIPANQLLTDHAVEREETAEFGSRRIAAEHHRAFHARANWRN